METNSVLHPDIGEVSSLTGMEEEEIVVLLDKYDLFLVSISEATDNKYLCRGLTIYEFNRLKNLYPDNRIMMDAIFRLCVIWPKNDSMDTEMAGVVETIASQILTESGLDDKSSERFSSLIDKNKSEMTQVFNQIPCIIHEAFHEFSMEEILQLPLRKLLWYHSRADWILSNLRYGLGPVQAAEQTEEDDSLAFPELIAEEKFKKGQLK